MSFAKNCLICTAALLCAVGTYSCSDSKNEKTPPDSQGCVNGNCDKPCEGENCDKPCEGENCNKPCEGENCDKPCEGDNCDKPCEGENCDKPCEGDNCNLPCEGDNCNAHDDLLGKPCTEGLCVGDVAYSCYENRYSEKIDCGTIPFEGAGCMKNGGEAICAAPCPDGKSEVELCSFYIMEGTVVLEEEPSYLDTYSCIDIAGKSYANLMEASEPGTRCYNGCKDNQCRPEQECDDNMPARCDGNSMIYCGGMILNNHELSRWETQDCSVFGEVCVELSDEDGGAACIKPGEECSRAGEERGSCLVNEDDSKCMFNSEVACYDTSIEVSEDEESPKLEQNWTKFKSIRSVREICQKAGEKNYWFIVDDTACAFGCNDGVCDNGDKVDTECSWYNSQDECKDNTAVYCSEHYYSFDRCGEKEVCVVLSKGEGGERTESSCLPKCDKEGEEKEFKCFTSPITFEETFPEYSTRYVCNAFEGSNGWEYVSERCMHGCNEATGKCNYIDADEGKACTYATEERCKNNMILECSDGFIQATECENGSVCGIIEKEANCYKPCTQKDETKCEGESESFVEGTQCVETVSGELVWKPVYDCKCVDGKCQLPPEE